MKYDMTGAATATATVLAVCALRAGDAVLANLALDKALADDPDNELAWLIHRALALGSSPMEIIAVIDAM